MKNLSTILILALLLPALAGCQNSASAIAQKAPLTSVFLDTTSTSQTNPAETKTTLSTITPDEAITIALKDAGLEKDQIRDLDAELDRDGRSVHYDVDFESKDYEYDYEIDAASGKILKSNKERD